MPEGTTGTDVEAEAQVVPEVIGALGGCDFQILKVAPQQLRSVSRKV